jgi:hypothetical protein
MGRIRQALKDTEEEFFSLVEIEPDLMDSGIQLTEAEYLVYMLSEGDLSKHDKIYNTSYELILKYCYYKILNKINELQYTIAAIRKNKERSQCHV